MQMYVLPLVAFANLMAGALAGAGPGAGSPVACAGPDSEAGTGNSLQNGATPGAGAKQGTVGAVDGACSGPNARTKPPPGAIVVDPSTEYNGSYLTITEALAYLPNVTEEQTIFLFPGLYKEQLYVPRQAGPLVLQGYTCDTMSYADNTVTITNTMSEKDLPSEFKDDRNALVTTMRFKSKSGVKVYNINVANPGGDRKDGGAAVRVEGTDYGFYGCNFTGYQDTLSAHRGRELFARSYISGAVDIVVGMRAMAWFESCDIETIEKGWIASNGNMNATIESEYVFNHARVFGSSGAGSTLLGRPWRPFARVVWQNSELGDVVNPKGWRTWNDTTSTDNVYFKEFNNSGPGAATSERVAFSGQLDAPVDITHILGDDYKSQWWVDPAFL